MRALLLAMLLMLGAFLVGGLVLPKDIRVERSVAIQRPPATVFTVVNRFDHFTQWSPWADLDPNAQFLVTGPGAGPGARVSWTGDPTLVGSGWLEIEASEPWQRVDMALELGEQGVSQTAFSIAGDSLGSQLSWTYATDVTAGQGMIGALMNRYVGLFLENWVAADFERGLSRLKVLIEAMPEGDFSTADIRLLETQPANALVISGLTADNAQALDQAVSSAFAELAQFMASAGIVALQPPMSVLHESGPQGSYMEAMIPVSRVPARTPPGIRTGLTPAGPAARVVHQGPYGTTATSDQQLRAWIAAHGLVPGPVSWEVYLDDPTVVPEQQLRTEIYYQLMPSD